jgi:hypothetical protein
MDMNNHHPLKSIDCEHIDRLRARANANATAQSLFGSRPVIAELYGSIEMRQAGGKGGVRMPEGREL